MKFIHAADLHLDSPLRGLEDYPGAPVEEIRGATRRALENLVDTCLAENADFLLIAGDVFDGNWKDYNTGLYFASQASRLREAGIPVFLIRGNHDAQSQISRQLQLPGNVRELSAREPETCSLESLGVAIHGQSFARPAVTEDLSARYPERVPGFFNIGLLHTSAGGREGHENYAPCSVEALAAKGYEYWALGHVHAREVLREEPWIVFPGNIQGRHIRETGEKGCCLLHVADGQLEKIEHRSLDVLRWALCEVDASGARDPDTVLEQVAKRLQEQLQHADGRPLAARVVVGGACPAHGKLTDDPEKWANEIRTLATDQSGGRAWIEKVKWRTSAAVDPDDLRQRPDALGSLFRYLDGLKSGEQSIEEYMDVFRDLKNKLPRALWEVDEPVRLEDPGFVRELLADVEQLLAGRLGVAPEE